MVLSRLMSNLRRRWPIAVVVAVVVAIVGMMLVRSTQSGAAKTTSMTQVGVTGPLREREQYAIDLDTVAASVSAIAAVYMESDVVLLKVIDELPPGTSLAALKSIVSVGLVPQSSILEIKATSADTALADVIVATMQREAIALIGQLGDKRFEGESPLTVTVLVDSTQVKSEPASTLIATIAVLLLAMIAGIAAALLRAAVDSRLRHRDDVTEISSKLPVIDGRWNDSAGLVRAEIDVAAAKVVLVVPAGEGDATSALAHLADQFDQSGQACRAVRLGGGSSEGFVDVSASEAKSLAERRGDGSRLTVAGDAASSTLTRAQLTDTLVTLGAEDTTVLVLTERPERSAGFALLRRSADMVVVVATLGVDRKRDLRRTLASVTDVRAESTADLVWSGA